MTVECNSSGSGCFGKYKAFVIAAMGANGGGMIAGRVPVLPKAGEVGL